MAMNTSGFRTVGLFSGHDRCNGRCPAGNRRNLLLPTAGKECWRLTRRDVHWMILLLPALASTLVMPGLFAQDAQSAAPAAAPDSFVWLDSDGNPLPFRSVEEMEDFLRTAEVVSSRELGEGITRPKKILLEKDGIRMNAIFRSVDIFRRKWKSQSGDKINFRDFYGFECAAYELSKLLGMQNYPPAVLKTIEGTKGSVQAWVEQAMTEEKRIAQGIQPQNSRIWLYAYG